MLAVLGNYLQNLNAEIESYEQLIAQKREEAQKLSQLQGQVVEALGLLKDIVDELSAVDPNAIATIKTAALQILNNGGDSSEFKPHLTELNDSEPNSEIIAIEAENTLESTETEDSLEIEIDRLEVNPTESEPLEEESNSIRLSKNVVYEPDKAIIYAGINSHNRAKAWGEWLCFTHTVGDPAGISLQRARFEILNQSRSTGHSYDLVIFGIQPEDAQRLADADLTKHPNVPENATWQPLKRHPQVATPKPQMCQPGDLAVGDIARKDDGREYRVIGVSDDGSVVKVVNEDNMEMAFLVGTLYLVKKAESEPESNLATVTEAFSNGKTNQQGLEIGSQVLIRSTRHQGKYNGKIGAIATEPSNLGLKVDMGDETPVFFLKDEVSLLN
jgi:hypothetical protein